MIGTLNIQAWWQMTAIIIAIGLAIGLALLILKVIYERNTKLRKKRMMENRMVLLGRAYHDDDEYWKQIDEMLENEEED